MQARAGKCCGTCKHSKWYDESDVECILLDIYIYIYVDM